MTFGGSEYEYGYGGIKTSDGGLSSRLHNYNDGDFTGLDNGKSGIFVIKLNVTGNKEWIKTYGGSGSDISISIIQTQDGGYILSGTSNSSDGDFTGLNMGLYNMLVLKISSSGEKQWIKNFGGIGNEGGNSIFQTLDEYVFILYSVQNQFSFPQ
jgi:hypothetical protein